MSGEAHPVAALVGEWAAAWNAGDADRLLAMAHPDFRMHRMKGDVIDREGLREAVARQTYGAAMKIIPLALYGHDNRFAAAARVEYREVETGELLGATDDGGMGFEVHERLVLVAAPQATLPAALAWAQVTDEELVASWTV